jgi:predicted enzyme related to lactoylglutathione lyase
MGSQAAGSHVVWFDVPCSDLDRAIAFYSAVLGWASNESARWKTIVRH